MGANAALWAMLSRPFPRVLSKSCPIATYGFIFRRKIGTIRIGDGYPMTIALGKSVELLPRMTLLQDFFAQGNSGLDLAMAHLIPLLEQSRGSEI
jgi:hypothetical protein